MKKKWLAGFLSAAMALTVLSACNGGDDQEDQDMQQQEENGDMQEENGDMQEGNNEGDMNQ